MDRNPPVSPSIAHFEVSKGRQSTFRSKQGQTEPGQYTMEEVADQQQSQNTSASRKRARRPKDFYKFDMTSLREPLLKAYYVAVACEHNDKSWELELKTILEMRRDEILGKIQAFMEAVDCDWPWSDDVRDFIESADNKGALQWKTG